MVDAPRCGVQAIQLNAAWITEVYQLRGALDALAARLAAERRQKSTPPGCCAGAPRRQAKTSGP